MPNTSDSPGYLDVLEAFLDDGRFANRGAVVTDLDGTAVLERDGRIYLPPEIESGLKGIHDGGRPVIANTLRFPRSVIRVFGDEWHRATATDLPLVTLKGSQTGCIVRSASGEVAFDEWHAEPLEASEVLEVLVAVEAMVGDGIRDLLVFHYPRDWHAGERIWTPDPTAVDHLRAKYPSASAVITGPVAALRDALLADPLCMIFLLVDAADDRLMAYQHTQRNNFFTHAGVSKRTGAEAISMRLGIDLSASIGAGDAPPDDFLNAVGFAVIVGNNEIDYRGLHHTVRVETIAALGDLLAVAGRSLA